MQKMAVESDVSARVETGCRLIRTNKDGIGYRNPATLRDSPKWQPHSFRQWYDLGEIRQPDWHLPAGRQVLQGRRVPGTNARCLPG